MEAFDEVEFFRIAIDIARNVGLLQFSIGNSQLTILNSRTPAVALCSNRISGEQAAKAAHLAREFSGGIVTIFIDCDPEGEVGHETVPRVLGPALCGAPGVNEQDARPQVQGPATGVDNIRAIAEYCKPPAVEEIPLIRWR